MEDTDPKTTAAPRRTPVLDPLRRRLPGAWADIPDGALGGQLLLASCGLIVTATAPLLHVLPEHRAPLALVCALMAVALATSVLLPWTRWSPHAQAAFPLSVLSALAAVAALMPEAGQAFVGIYVLCFMYSGLFLARGTRLLVLPLGIGGYLQVLMPLDEVDLVRTAIVSVVWLLLIEVLGALTTRQRHVVEDLLDDVTTDALTRVGNRRGLDRRLLTALPGDLVVMCDLDHFKRVNDTLGHARGDLVLRDFGQTLHDQLRGQDYVARFGGEEFLLHLVDTAPVEGALMLQRLHAVWAKQHPEITFSSGASACLPGGPGPAVEAADRALYRAKEGGRDRDEFLDAVPAAPAAERPLAREGLRRRP